MNLFGENPPEWLQRRALLNEQQNTQSMSELAEIASSAVVGGVRSFQKDPATGKNYSFLSSFNDAYQSISDPFYTLKRKEGEFKLASAKMGLEADRVNLDIQHENLKNVSHDHGVLADWQKAHPSWQSRIYADPPEIWSDTGRKQYDSIVLNDSRQPQKAAFLDGLKETGKSLDTLRKIDPVGAAQFSNVQQWTPELNQKLQDTVAAAQGKIDTENERVQQEMADYEAKGYTITRQWTDTRGRLRYAKTAPKTAPVKTEKVSSEDVYERDPDTGEYHKVISGTPSQKEQLTLLDGFQKQLAAEQVKPKKDQDQHWIAALNAKIARAKTKLYPSSRSTGGAADESEASPGSLAGRVQDMTHPMTAERYTGDTVPKSVRDRLATADAQTQKDWDEWMKMNMDLRKLRAADVAASQGDAAAVARLDAIPGRSAGGGAASGPSAPKKGSVVDGYEFQGGDPSDPSNWKPVK